MLPRENDYGLKPSSGAVSSIKKKELERIAVQTMHRLIDDFGDTSVLENADAAEKKQLAGKINEIMNRVAVEYQSHLSQTDKQKVVQYVTDEVFGFGPINSMLEDPTVSEVMVNGCRQVYVERNGTIHRTDITFRDDAHVLHTIEKIVVPLGRRVDESSPMVDARLPDGSRVNAIIPPLAINGPTLTIRKFATESFTQEDLISMGTLTHEIAHFLRACVRSRMNIIVSGGTGSGKTTTLNVLSGFISGAERIVTIEDAAELQLKQEHIVTLESRPPNNEGKGEVTIRDLVRNSLRMRPDRIIVGEVRSGEALDMMQAMNTGHDGSISTLHANTPRDALARLETMVLMAGMELPHRAIREQISSAINLVIHQSRYPDGSRKISQITEVVGMEGDTLTLQDIYLYEQSGLNEKGKVIGRHVPTGLAPTFTEKLRAFGEKIPLEMFKPAVMSRSGRL